MRRFRLLFFLPACAWSLCYDLHFVGFEDRKALAALKEGSNLVALQSRPPASINGLRYRIEADIPALIKILHAFSYYDASITSNIETSENVAQVYLFINAGSPFALTSYEVYHQSECNHLADILGCCPLTPAQLGLEIGKPALSTDIVNAELRILTELSRCGYPLAYIDKRKVEVDMQEGTLQAGACVQEGPLSKFGATTIFGLENIKPHFIESKIRWAQGEVYDSDLIVKTQEKLLKSELFSSVYISHGDLLNSQGELPMKMSVSEAKHQRISLGAFYGPADGFGGRFAWSHRNIGGMGDILSIKADGSPYFLLGNITYKKTDCFSFDQTYRAFGEISKEDIRAYNAFIYRAGNYLERPLHANQNGSLGLKIEHINVSQSASNGTYLLMGLPIFMRYSGSDDFLNPTKGYAIIYSATPYQSLFFGNQHFVKQRFTTQAYIPLNPKRSVVLALRCQFGSVAGTNRSNVPLTKLFLGGSEDDLRGYRYKTVSPLNENRKPLGGRSAIFTTTEVRFRVNQKIGIVSFADLGTVSNLQWPDFTKKWYKSVGIGLRYFAFFGPFRIDVGFPLNRREGIDPQYQFYASVGQTF